LSFRVGGVVLSRLLLALSVILTPIYFLLLFAFSPVKLRPAPLPFDIVVANYPLFHSILQYSGFEQPWIMVINYIFAPLFFSLPWLLFVALNHERIIRTFEVLDATTTIVPLRYRIFYGFNTLLLLVFFLLPALFPVLSVVSSVILVGRVLNTSEWFWRHGKIVKIATCIIAFTVICWGPVYLTALYYLERLHVFLTSWLWDLWANNMVITYTVSMCIVNALAIGSIVWLIFAGSAEFEAKTFGVALTKPPYRAIAILEAVFFILFIYIGLPYIYVPGWPPRYLIWGSNPSILYDRINYICLGLISLVTLVGMTKGLRRRTFNFSLFGLIIAGGFLGLDMVTGNYIRTLAILPKMLTPFILSVTLSSPWGLLTMDINYFLNLYIPYYELPRALMQIYFFGGAQTALTLAMYVVMLIHSSVTHVTSAMTLTALIWVTTTIYCFAKAGTTRG